MRFTLLAALLFGPSALAADIEVSGAKVQSYPVALAKPISSDPALRSRGGDVLKRVDALLGLTGMIKTLDPASFLARSDEGMDPQQIDFEAWRNIGAKGLLKLGLRRQQNRTMLDYLVLDVTSGRPLANGSLQARSGGLENLAGQIADAVILGLTGEPGPFRSQLAFVRQSGRNKTVWISDPDGAQDAAAAVVLVKHLGPQGAWLPVASQRPHGPGIHPCW